MYNPMLFQTKILQYNFPLLHCNSGVKLSKHIDSRSRLVFQMGFMTWKDRFSHIISFPFLPTIYKGFKYYGCSIFIHKKLLEKSKIAMFINEAYRLHYTNVGLEDNLPCIYTYKINHCFDYNFNIIFNIGSY